MDLVLNNLQRLICHKTQQTKPAETMIDADYEDDLALFVNTPVQAKCQLHSQEQAT